uniref:Uncharacterized protein n=1 Tax=Dulem virus 158 TaxID=3145635 RepID=A0AAU8B6L9_9VIRU
MKFRDLVQVNKTWSRDSHLFILNGSSLEADSMLVKTAVTLYGNCDLLWFRGDVVMLA